MSPEKSRQHINVDELQHRLSVTQIAQFYRYPLPDNFSEGGEQRISCPCSDCQGSSDTRSVAINTSDPFKQWKCFRENYGCGAKGNAVTLAYCMKHGRMPSGGKPTGKEFYAIAQDLQAMDLGMSIGEEARPQQIETNQSNTKTQVVEVLVNTPLADSANAGARKLVDLDKQLIRDPADMSAAASAYGRRHPFLLSEVLAKECRTGFMPGKAKSTLRGQWVFGVMSEANEPLAWIGRNVKYEDDVAAWQAGGKRGQEPMKYRFPKQELFRRGCELAGQEFVGQDRFKPSLEQYGVILVEGFNDRMRLQELGVLGLSIMSNQITDEQIEKVSRLASDHSDNRVGLMFDLDEQGQEGAKETLWKLHQRNINAYLVWTRKTLKDVVKRPEPEHLTIDEWEGLKTQ